MTEKSKPDDNKARKEIAFHFIKSPQFRVIHADGVIGGLTPNNNIHFALFSERLAIPQEVIHTINPDGSLGGERKPKGKEGIVREMDVDVVMSLETAVVVHEWLTKRIEELKARLEKIDGIRRH